MGAPLKPQTARNAESKDPFPGTVINGKYRVHSVLAHGGMGKIYQAEQVPLGRPVALKILRTRYADETEDDPQFQKRFLLEASILSRLQHNHIVRLYDYGRIENLPGDQYFMAMELLHGDTLSRRLRNVGPMPIADVLRIVRQIAKGLSAAHKLEVVHRDLKPSNIMLVPEEDGVEVVKILDFGISKIVTSDSEDLTAEGAFLGSPRYMAPEQVSDGKVDIRTDIYSLGVIMYECLSGKIPFDGETNIGIMMAHCNTPVPAMRDRNPSVQVPEVLEGFARHCLQKGPLMRPKSMEEFLRELGACESVLSGNVAAVHSSGSLPTMGPISQVSAISSGTSEAPTRTGTFSDGDSVPAGPSGPTSNRNFPSSAPTGTHRSLTRSQVPPGTEATPAQARDRSKVMLIAALMIFGLGALGTGLFLLRASPPAPAAESRRTSFTLTIESTPSGGEVKEGDKILGATPVRVAIDHASVGGGGQRKFVVTRDGYAPYAVYQGDSPDDLRVVATLVAEPPAPTASATPSANATTAGRPVAATAVTTPTAVPAPTRATNNPDLDIKLKR